MADPDEIPFRRVEEARGELTWWYPPVPGDGGHDRVMVVAIDSAETSAS